jgi:hypothetical protein
MNWRATGSLHQPVFTVATNMCSGQKSLPVLRARHLTHADTTPVTLTKSTSGIPELIPSPFEMNDNGIVAIHLAIAYKPLSTRSHCDIAQNKDIYLPTPNIIVNARHAWRVRRSCEAVTRIKTETLDACVFEQRLTILTHGTVTVIRFSILRLLHKKFWN